MEWNKSQTRNVGRRFKKKKKNKKSYLKEP